VMINSLLMYLSSYNGTGPIRVLVQFFQGLIVLPTMIMFNLLTAFSPMMIVRLLIYCNHDQLIYDKMYNADLDEIFRMELVNARCYIRASIVMADGILSHT